MQGPLTEGRGLGRLMARALGLSMLASTAGRAVTVLATFALARLLSPTDFGVASLGLLIVLVLQPVTDIGIAQALVRAEQRDIARRALTAFWLVILLGIALYALLFFTADAIAAFYGRQEIAPMIRVISLSIPLYSASRIPTALLERQLRFGRRGAPEVLASLTYGTVAVALAYLHFGFWSIVAGTLARAVVLSTGVYLTAGWRPGWTFEPSVAQELITYARYLMAGALLRLAYTNVDNALVGKVLGMTALGFYALAYNMGNLVADQISQPLAKVLFPTYTRMLPDLRRTRSAALLMLRYTSIVISPVTVLGVVSVPHLVPVVLGPKWIPLTLSLQFMLVYGWVRTVSPIHWALMLAADLTRASTRINLITLALALAVAYPVAKTYGFAGVAADFTLMEVLRLLLIVQVDRRHLGIPWGRQAGAVLPSLAASLVAGLTLLVLQAAWPPATAPLMGVELIASSLAYVTCLGVLGVLRGSSLTHVMNVVRPPTQRG